ncbi:shikimate kinase [Ahrensia marina]|uniref:shikimate kinase n=1 Tax=Ahrensia marina TaxID=1514904 RepID=UPI0035D10779
MTSHSSSNAATTLDEAYQPRANAADIARIREGLGTRAIVIVGMMGAGKSSIGRRLAQALHIEFVDSDDEIEKAANLTIPEIFETYGEAHFRDGERKVIARLLSDGSKVIAVGGGAFENPQTRQDIAEHGLSIWLKADFETLMARVRRRSHRPLLQNPDPEGTMLRLLDARAPNYALADLTVPSRDGAHADVVQACLHALGAHLQNETDPK